MSDESSRPITPEGQELLEMLAPRQHNWVHTEEGTPKCTQCRLWPDDPFVRISGGWKSGQCWGLNGVDFIMSFVTSGVSTSDKKEEPDG